MPWRQVPGGPMNRRGGDIMPLKSSSIRKWTSRNYHCQDEFYFQTIACEVGQGHHHAAPSHRLGSCAQSQRWWQMETLSCPCRKGPSSTAHRPEAGSRQGGCFHLCPSWFCCLYLTYGSDFWDSDLHKQLGFQPHCLDYSSSAKRRLFPFPHQDPLSVSLSDMHCSSAHHQHETKSLLGGLCKPRILSFHCPQILSICSSRQMEDLALGLPGGAVRICWGLRLWSLILKTVSQDVSGFLFEKKDK